MINTFLKNKFTNQHASLVGYIIVTTCNILLKFKTSDSKSPKLFLTANNLLKDD